MSSSVLVVDRPYNGDNDAIFIPLKTMKELKLDSNSYVLVSGNELKKTICKVQKSDGKPEKVLLNRLNRHNLGVYLSDAVTIQPCKQIPVGLEVSIELMNCSDNRGISKESLKQILRKYFIDSRRVLYEKNKFIVRCGMRALEFVVLSITPEPYCYVSPSVTSLKFSGQTLNYKDNEKLLSDVSYDDIGGYNGVLQQIRNSLEFPLRFPRLFLNLEVELSRAIFYGPHGCGKVLTAQAIANETGARFVLMNQKNVSKNGPNKIIDNIIELFGAAIASSPSVICIDDFDYFLPKQFKTPEIKEIGRTMVAQITNLCKINVAVTLIAITKDIQNVQSIAYYDLFKNTDTIDRKFKFKIPDISARIQILMILTRNLNLSKSFSITDLASATADFTAAKLARLCKKVAIRNKIVYDLSAGEESDETYFLFKQCLTIEDFKVCLKDKEFQK